MGVRDPRGLLPWWHGRVVIVSDDDAWATAASEEAVALNALEGPVGALATVVTLSSAG